MLTCIPSFVLQNTQVTAQLRQVGHQVPGATLNHYTLNPAVSVEETLRDVTPEEVSDGWRGRCVYGCVGRDLGGGPRVWACMPTSEPLTPPHCTANPTTQVCMYESMCAGVRRLLDEGIDLVGKVEALAPPKVEAVLASNLQRLLQQRQER